MSRSVSESAMSPRVAELLRRARVWKYRALCTCPHVSGAPTVLQPALFLGEGRIVFGEGVELGWRTSTGFHTGYCHFEASKPQAAIEVGAGVQINNNAFIKSEGPGIRIGRDTLLGSEVTIYDSDFHDLRAGRRRDGRPKMGAVELAQDVFVGDRVLILKGVRIGAHAVIGAGSVVTRSIPAGVIAAGNPARVIGELPGEGAEIPAPSGR